LRYAGFPEFVKTLVDIGFLDDAAQDFLAADASEIAWVSLLSFFFSMDDVDREKKKSVLCGVYFIASFFSHFFFFFGLISYFFSPSFLDEMHSTLERRRC
jgi:hypothetical protein